MTQRIYVRDEIGRYAVSQEDGAKIRELVEHHIDEDRPVVLDFEGVDVHVTVFYNEAIGRLYVTRDTDLVDRLISAENLSEHGRAVFEESREHARWFARLTPEQRADFQRGVDDILEEND